MERNPNNCSIHPDNIKQSICTKLDCKELSFTCVDCLGDI